MIEDMTVRNFGASTQREYIRAVKKLAAFLHRSPDTATAEVLRRFQVDLVGGGATPSTVNSTVTALRFFFATTVDRPEITRHLALVHQPRKIPVVLAQEEVARLLEMTPGVKYQTAFSVAYGAGLRVSEVAALKVSDIDSERMRLRVEQGKGRKDREAMLPVPYFHVVFTLPAAIAYQNKRVIYNLLFKASAEAMQTISGDPKHLGAMFAITALLHTWGSAD